MSEEANLEATYQEMVFNLFKPGQAILAALTPEKAQLLHGAVGIAGEAGELLDAVKKNTIHGKELDRTNAIEELGDLEFYLEAVRQVLDVSRAEVLEANYKKLGVRYASGTYSDAQSAARADKAGDI